MEGDAQTCEDAAGVEISLEPVTTRLNRGSDMAARTALNISPEKRAKIEELLKKGVGIYRVAVETSSGNGTVTLVRDQLMETQPELFKKHMAGNLHRIANKTAAVIERSVDNMVEEGVKPNQVPGLSVALGILLDKQAQLMGETPVSVVEHRHLLDPEAIKTALLRVAGADSPEPINVTATATGSSESVIAQ